MQVSPDSPPLEPIRSKLSIDGTPRTFYTRWSTPEDGYIYRAFSFKELLSTARITNLIHDWDCAIPLKLYIKDRFSAAISEHRMVDVLRHLPFAHLQCVAVYIPGGTDISERFWRDLFSLTRGLRYVKLIFTTLRGFAAALSPDYHGWTGQNQPLAAPALEEIQLKQVSFAIECEAHGVGLAMFLRRPFPPAKRWRNLPFWTRTLGWMNI